MGAKRPELLNLIPKGILDWADYPCSLYIELFLFWLTESVQRHLAPDYTTIMSRTLKVTFDFPSQRSATLAILVSDSATVPNGFVKDAIVVPALNSRADFYGLGILDDDARLMGFWKMTILTLRVTVFHAKNYIQFYFALVRDSSPCHFTLVWMAFWKMPVLARP